MVRKATSYLALRERLSAGGLPYDDYAERCAIGAVLGAPVEHAKRMSRKLFEDHFYVEQHGWLWARLSWAHAKLKVDWDDKVSRYLWLRKEKIVEKYRQKFGCRLSELVGSCIEPGFWWHGDYYIDRVIAAARLRGRIKRAAGDLAETLNQADDGWLKGRWS